MATVISGSAALKMERAARQIDVLTRRIRRYNTAKRPMPDESKEIIEEATNEIRDLCAQIEDLIFG